MCGIAGFITDRLSIKEVCDYSRSLRKTLLHRGPDSQTVKQCDGCSFIHTRLAIRGGREAEQPILTSCGRYLIAYNGEIYNVPQLVSILIQHGVRVEFDRSDTYVLQLWIGTFGLTRISDIEGTFAFAVFDNKNKSLSLVRDRLGVKPLFYTHRPANSRLEFGFSSELGSLVRAFGIRSKLDNQFLSEYLWFGSGCGNNTVYADIKSVPPGSILTFSSHDISIDRWFDLYESYLHWHRAGMMSLDDASSTAVARQMISDVPIGLFLSSGIDSTLLASKMRDVSKAAFTAVTAIFDSGSVQEVEIASKTALNLDVKHCRFSVQTGDVEKSIIKLLDSYGEPFGDAASIPLLQMCNQLSDLGLRVVLQGDGGDELFAGYNRYQYLSSRLFKLFGRLPKGIFKALPPCVLSSRLQRWYEISRASAPEAAALLLTEETKSQSPFMLLENSKREMLEMNYDPFRVYKEHDARLRDVDSKVDRQILIDLQVQLPTQFLPKVDRASMCVGVEARVPLLDETLLQAALTIPAKMKVSLFDKKIALKKMLKRSMPSYRIKKSKLGFSTPYQYWLANELYEKSRSVVLDPEFISVFGFDGNQLKSLFAIPKGTIDGRMYTRWKIYVLGLWYQNYGVFLE